MSELSIVIPTYNRAARLRSCLKSLGHQTQPATDFEVIVIDDGSTDGTPEMLAEIETPYPLRVIRQAREGQCAALNRGITSSRQLCLILDDDIIPGPVLVSEHLRAQYASGGVVAIGQLTMQASPGDDWYAVRFTQRWREHYQHLNEGSRPLTWQDCYSGNLSAPRQVLLEAGGFDVGLQAGFDIELGYRLQRMGIPMIYLPTACGEHQDDKAGRQLLNEDERSGRMMFELIQRHPELFPELLGQFWDTSQRAILLRRLFLNLGIAPRLLAKIGPFMPGEHWNREWFRFVSAYAYWYGARQTAPDRETWQRLTHSTPILMYHAFGKPGEPASRYILPERRFARQMAWLKRLGYNVLSLENYLHDRQAGHLPSPRSVIITIDDGYTDNYTVAYPILQRYGFAATIFLVSGYVGDANCWDQGGLLRGRALMAWPEIREMLGSGVSFGAHTRTHPFLPNLALEHAHAEIAGSRADLEQELGQPIRLFSYPHGEYNTATCSIVEQAGYTGACSVHTGMNSVATPAFELRRTEVYGTDSFLRFALALWLGDDYLPPRRGRRK